MNKVHELAPYLLENWYRISPCIMRWFFSAIHVTKRHLVLYIDEEFITFF